MSMGWETLNAAVEDARALIAAEAPDAEVAAEGEAYVTRMVAAGLGGALLGHLFREGGLTRALPVHGGPNPDYIMLHSGIDAAGRYRIEGRLNGSERVGIGVYTIGPNGAPLIAGYTAFDSGNCAPDGAFALTLAADAGEAGGLAIPPGARILMVRILHRGTSDPARITLTGGHAAAGPTLMGGSNDGALVHVAKLLRANVREYLKWMAAARDLPNRLDNAPPALAETVQGDADTRYFLGGFDLAEGEWLEVVMPPGITGYWSLHVYNFWYEHLQTPGVHDGNAVLDDDGHVRIAVGPAVPAGASNRIDTVGRRKGAFVCRIVGNLGAIGRPETRLHRSDGTVLP
ncbi:hypothetical protein EDF56_108129 [Novosphingobium sp. PhB165]|uniref:hypothetical protein n=1 Tax=Novosphingobium sp. PhB165 TaxID=2485105 RepID=UPI00104F9EF5|nr:hypothetical protein [Novosphingobium sp. PhB165]TCM16140.1 hypothetical protein EDF56_108129 [Novosphingobium sp. PhB165]